MPATVAIRKTSGQESVAKAAETLPDRHRFVTNHAPHAFARSARGGAPCWARTQREK